MILLKALEIATKLTLISFLKSKLKIDLLRQDEQQQQQRQQSKLHIPVKPI